MKKRGAALAPRSHSFGTNCLLQFDLMGIELGLANRTVVAHLELLPHAVHLGICCCFGSAQFAIVIGVEASKGISGSGILARTLGGVSSRRTVLGVRVGASVGRRLARDLGVPSRRIVLVGRAGAAVGHCLARALVRITRGRRVSGRGECRDEQRGKQQISDCIHRGSL